MRKAIIAVGYAALLISLALIALLEPKSNWWGLAIFILIVWLSLGLNFGPIIQRKIGIHGPAILVSTGNTLLALLFHATAPFAAIAGALSIAAVLVVNRTRRGQTRVSDRRGKLTTEFTAKLDLRESLLQAESWELTMPGELDQLENSKLALEKRKLALEEERFAWQKAVDRQRNSFINRNLGVIITSIVSIAAVTVSYVQLEISSNNAKNTLDNERLRNDRQFYLEAAKFLLDPQQVTTTDKVKALQLKNLALSGLPPELAFQVALRMRQNASTNDIRKIWEEGVMEAIHATKNGFMQCAPGDSVCVRKFMSQCDSVCMIKLLSVVPER